MDHAQVDTACHGWQMPQFKTGEKNGPGRPKGRLNNTTLEARKFAHGLVASPGYRKSLKQRLDGGTLAPALEAMLHHYAYGKPPDRVELTGADQGPLRVLFGGRYRETGGDAA
jgi:hypothetical protein